MAKLPYPIVYIEWDDAHSGGSGWDDFKNIKEPEPWPCVSIGFLVKENKKGVVLVMTIADDPKAEDRSFNGELFIPT